jgi:hypothetical protein
LGAPVRFCIPTKRSDDESAKPCNFSFADAPPAVRAGILSGRVIVTSSSDSYRGSYLGELSPEKQKKRAFRSQSPDPTTGPPADGPGLVLTHPRDGCVAFEQKKFVRQSQGCNKSCARFLFGHQHSHRALANCWLPQTTRSYAAEGDVRAHR